MKSCLNNLLEEASSGRKKLCIFGTGYAARLCSFILENLKIKIYCYTDNDSIRWGSFVNGLPCISPKELFVNKDKYVCIIAIGKKLRGEVGTQLEKAGFNNWIYVSSLYGLFREDAYIVNTLGIKELPPYIPLHKKYPSFFNRKYIKDDRVAVYSCIVGNYDTPLLPHVFPKKIDYYMITDNIDIAIKVGWKNVIDIKNILPVDFDYTDYKLVNRYCKMNGNRLFPDYRYSIYIDGKLRPRIDISKYVKCTSKVGISTCIGGIRGVDDNGSDLYGEMHDIILLYYGRGILVGDELNQMKQQLRRYAKEGFPRQKYQIEASAIVRDHDNPMADKIMQDWYEEFEKGFRRDQLSFEYVLWKNGIDLDDYNPIPDDSKDIFEWVEHPHVLENMKRLRY